MNMQATLSKREDQVTELLVWGAANKQVAGILMITEDTVVNHKRNIYKKLGVNCIAKLCAWWFCTRFSIPISLSPIPMIAFLFFALSLPDYSKYKKQKRWYYIREVHQKET